MLKTFGRFILPLISETLSLLKPLLVQIIAEAIAPEMANVKNQIYQIKDDALFSLQTSTVAIQARAVQQLAIAIQKNIDSSDAATQFYKDAFKDITGESLLEQHAAPVVRSILLKRLRDDPSLSHLLQTKVSLVHAVRDLPDDDITQALNSCLNTLVSQLQSSFDQD